MARGVPAIALLVVVIFCGSGRSFAQTLTDPRTAIRSGLAGTYANASIADIALRYVGKPGWTACADAGRSGLTGGPTAVQPQFDASGNLIKEGDGQCRAFVNCIVWMASGHTQWLGGGANYFSLFLSPNGGPPGVGIKDISQLVKGDIIQWGNGVHTYVIVKRVSGGTFTVVDSNHDLKETVLSYDRKITLNATQRAFRMGRVKVPPLIAFYGGDGTGRQDGVFLTAADGTGARFLTADAEGPLSWSPRGDELAFTYYGAPGACKNCNEIYGVTLQGTERRLTHGANDSAPAWSPNGKLIAFRRSADVRSAFAAGWSLYVVASNGTGIRRLTNGLDVGEPPVWSPDSKHIAIQGRDGIYVVRADGGRVRRLTARKGDIWPSWSPDGTRVAFLREVPTREYPGGSDIFVVRADGTQIRALTNQRHGSNGAPTWSPDGKRIAFARYGHGLCGDSIYVMAADGNAERRLTPHAAGYTQPMWSPDGTRLAFRRYIQGCQPDQGYGGVYVMPSNGGRQRLLAKTWFLTDVAWQPSH